MDDVESVRDLSTYFPSLQTIFNIYSDPVYSLFEHGIRVYKGEALILTVITNGIFFQ